ncbi:MAG: FkbM family methyltransferase [Chitinophagaceae bacterium]|nr:FkbM family methyltransferase [Chitinophagaceae bacterium]
MTKQSILEFVNYFFNLFHLSVKRYPSREQRRLIRYLKNNHVDYVLDVGANVGQFATHLFRHGYQGKIFSFEPQSLAFKKLSKKANQQNWIAINKGLGEVETKLTINNAANSVSSSILPILSEHTAVAKESVYVNSEEIVISTVDIFLRENNIAPEQVFLKIDTQGYENMVLNGASNSLHAIKVLQVEMSLTPLYEGEILFDELKKKIESFGFALAAVESGLANEQTGKLLQLDAIFIK